MEKSNFNRFIIISISIHLIIGLIFCFINFNYFRQPDLKIVEISLLNITPSKNFLDVAKSMVAESMLEKICKKTGSLKNKEKIEPNSYLKSFKVKEGIIERDHLALKELENINLKTHLEKVLTLDHAVISKEIAKDKLAYDLSISKDTREEISIAIPEMERKANLLAKEKESLLDNLSNITKISGPVSFRKILYREDFTIPSWLEKKGLNLQGKFKFWVLANGYVDRVLVEESFGFRQIDSLASSAISKWRFSQLPDYLKNKEEWGLIDIKILLR